MSSRTLDLRKVWGTIITYNYINEALVAPDKPFTSITELFPGGESPVHAHPEQEEMYEVQEGEMEIMLDGEWKTLSAGEKITIPKGTPHAVRNTSEEKAIATNTHSPGLRIGEMLETIQQYIADKKIKGPRGFKNMAYMASIILNYPSEMEMVKPTAAQTKMVARAGRVFGYR
jgi:mannose-6-phosphate isomerase-like protein (cupin superfamily)